ncbi:MAG: hypothetical protein Q8M17_04415 [Actinomycetota bacterium]|nr:hypothetical protein [Actinomycetota bacterium]
MLRLRQASVGVVLALVVSSAVMPLARAADQPGEPCSTEGFIQNLGTGFLVCTNGVWQASSTPPPPPLGTPPAGAGAGSTAKVAKIFKPVGTALSQDTFGSTGKQVADATAFRLPDGRVRIFAFVNVTTGLPGLRSATSTTKAGTSFVSDGTDPFPGTPVGQPRAFPLGGNSLRLFFAEAGTVQTAVSSDGGVTFTRQGPVITTEQAGFEPGVISVIKHKGVYRAYFSNLEKPGVHAERVMRTATSTDLMTWTMGPSVVAAGGSHPFAVTDKTGRVAIYYAADRGSTYGIWVSTSKDGINFSKEKLVVVGGGDADIIRAASGGGYLMYYGADLGGNNFGIKVAKSIGKVIP